MCAVSLVWPHVLQVINRELYGVWALAGSMCVSRKALTHNGVDLMSNLARLSLASQVSPSSLLACTDRIVAKACFAGLTHDGHFHQSPFSFSGDPVCVYPWLAPYDCELLESPHVLAVIEFEQSLMFMSSVCSHDVTNHGFETS